MSKRKPSGGSRLAENRRQWVSLASSRNTPFIRSLSEFDAHATDGRFSQSALGGLPSAALDKFRASLRFVEVSLNGAPRRRYLLSFGYRQLVKKYRFSDTQLLEVAALFGIGPKLFGATPHRFGDFDKNGNIICRPRLYFFCGRLP
jgi:hypothetical protein